MDLFRDPVWQSIGAIVSVAALLTSIWLYRRSRQKRALACEFGPVEFPIEIEADDVLRRDIEVHYKGRVVDNLFLVQCLLTNTGNLPIRRAQVVEPVTFTFGSGVELLGEPQILRKSPRNLEVDWELRRSDPDAGISTAALIFDLLNPGDELTMKFTCAGKNPEPEVTARIEGLAEIETVDFREKRQREAAILRSWEVFNTFYKIAVSVVVALIVVSSVATILNKGPQSALAGRLIELLMNPVRSVIESVSGVPCYRAGFIAGVMGSLIVLWTSRWLLYWWNRVLQRMKSVPELP